MSDVFRRYGRRATHSGTAMGEFTLRITSRAERGLREIVEYIARDNPRAAERVGLRLIEQVELLKKFPKLDRRMSS